MKKIDVIAGEESYSNLSTFNDIEEMNKIVRTYKDTISASVLRVDVQARLIALLELLKRYSCKQLGVSYMRKNTIANKLQLSYKTVQRLVKKLEDLGMIRQVATKRKKDMLQTANAIIILPAGEELKCRSKQENAGAPAGCRLEMSDKTGQKESEKCPTNKTKSSLKQIIKDLNKRKGVNISDDFLQANFIAHWVPKDFADLANCFFHEAKTIQELWKVVRQNNRIVNFTTNERAFTKDQELEIGVMAIKEFVMKIKTGIKIKNMFGYFNGIVDNLMDELFFDEDFMEE